LFFGRSISSAIAAIASSSLREQCEKSGARRIRSIFALR
jgi:hypothetical protein